MFGARRRNLVVHPAHKTVGVSRASFDLPAARSFAKGQSVPVAEQTLRVGLLAGPGGDRSDRSVEVLSHYLERSGPGVSCDVCPQVLDDWATPADFAGCRSVVVFLDQRLRGETLAAVARHVWRGGGVVGLRAADGDWLHPKAIGRDLFDAECQGRHPCPERPQVEVVRSGGRHPVAEGVRPFPAGENLAKVRLLGPDVEVLLRGSAPGIEEAVAWTRLRGSGRGFCTTLGHPADFRQPSFLRLLFNAVVWASGPDFQP